MSGESHTFYANEVSGLESERAVHPFRIEVRTVQSMVRTLALELLQADKAYLETFERNHLLAQVEWRRSRAATITEDEIKFLQETATSDEQAKVEAKVEEKRAAPRKAAAPVSRALRKQR